MRTKPGNLPGTRAITIIATVTAFTVPFMGSAVNVALPSIGARFNMDAVALGWVATSYLLATAVFLIPFGRLADILGRKRIFTLGVIIFTLASIFAAVSTSTAMLIFFRFCQGAGAAMTTGTVVAILTSAFPPGDRGRVLGLNVAAVYLGLSTGPFLGGILTSNFGWQSVFWLTVPLGFITIVATVWKLKGEWAEAKGERFDFAGSIIYSLGMVAFMYGLSRLPDASATWVILVGIIALLAFIRLETKISSPIINLALFRDNPVFTFSNLAALISYAATFAVSFLLSLYLQYIKGLSPQSAGLILVVMPAIQAVFSPSAGKLSDRVEPRIVATIGMALTTVGLIMLIFLNQDTSIGVILASLAVLGSGFALFSSPNTNAVMGAVDKKSYGVASGILGTMRSTGMMLSMAIAMVIFAIFIGRVEITPEYHASFIKSIHIAFIVFSALCFGGIFASLARGNVKRDEGV